jgi:hypothetical protein
MSIQKGKIKFEKKPKKGILILAILTLVEFLFTIFLTISLSAYVLFPEKTAEAVPGVSKILSYQGRLTDSSGNPLGGSGTNYCFRFSIYDSASGGTKLWPSGTPSNNIVNVSNGVFNVGIGQADDLGTFDFSSNDTIYLQVEVANYSGTCGTYEVLSPRQRIDAVGYARVSAGIYSSSLRNSSTSVQIGLGTGSANPVLLVLDTKNTSDTIGGTCTTNGAIWYNSSNSKALVCDNGTIRIVGSLGELAAIGVNALTPISAGTVVFSNSNNVTFGLNGSTITASANSLALAASNNTYTSGTVVISGGPNITVGTNGQTITISGAGGGGGANVTLYDFANLSWRDFITNVTNMTALSQRPIFVPFYLPGYLTWNVGAIEVSRATAGSNLFTAQFGIYTFANSTQISLLDSWENTYSHTNTGSVSGVRRINFTGVGGASALTPGLYVLGMYFSASAGTASMNYSLRGAQTVGPPVGVINPGDDTAVLTATNQLSSIPMQYFLGRYTNTSAGLPSSVARSQVQQFTSGYQIYFHLYQS